MSQLWGPNTSTWHWLKPPKKSKRLKRIHELYCAHQIFVQSFLRASLDEGQITHLICARLKHDLYDFLGGVLGLLPVLFL